MLIQCIAHKEGWPLGVMSDRFSGRDGSTIDGSSFSGWLTCVEIGGGEKLLSIDAIHWSTRAAFAP